MTKEVKQLCIMILGPMLGYTLTHIVWITTFVWKLIIANPLVTKIIIGILIVLSIVGAMYYLIKKQNITTKKV